MAQTNWPDSRKWPDELLLKLLVSLEVGLQKESKGRKRESDHQTPSPFRSTLCPQPMVFPAAGGGFGGRSESREHFMFSNT